MTLLMRLALCKIPKERTLTNFTLWALRDLVTFASIFCSFYELQNIVLRDPVDFARTNGAKSLFKSHILESQRHIKPQTKAWGLMVWCGSLLSYFELLPNNITWQYDMETYIESYHLSQYVKGKNNLENIAM